jgi:hypothetical protein
MDVKFQNSEYEMHQVGPKDSVSLNFSFIDLKAEAVCEAQILRTPTATARARDGRKFCYFLNHVIYADKVLKMKMSKNIFLFFSTVNHIFHMWQVKLVPFYFIRPNPEIIK